MLEHYLLDPSGQPRPEPDPLKWALAWEKQRVVKSTHVEDFRVSTIFLGLDHGFGGGSPVLFETMIFGPGEERDCFRYCTRDEALAHHDQLVGKLRDDLAATPQATLSQFRLPRPPTT